MSRTPVHLVAGFLGTGKTTTLRHTLSRLPGRSAVIVNDFGEAAIDATLLDGAVKVNNIPGGCVCCTAPDGLVPALAAILDELAPDRIFIEPSGLARPQDVLDMVSRSPLSSRVALGPVVVMVDPRRMGAHPLLEEQLEGADVVVANRVDLASEAELVAFREAMAAREPAPLRVVETQHGVVPDEAWEWPEDAGLRLTVTRARRGDSVEGFSARSAVVPAGRRFSFDGLRAALDVPEVVRFKGHVHTDAGWLRLERAGGELHSAATAWRRDSRWDLIVSGDDTLAEELQAKLLALEATEAELGVLERVDREGRSTRFTRADLRRYPGQVPDISALFPGRVGCAVPLADVLGPAPVGAQFVLVAADGMVSAPAPPEAALGAWLVYSLDGAALPAKQGGPFRVLAKGSSCANVKGLVRLRWV